MFWSRPSCTMGTDQELPLLLLQIGRLLCLYSLNATVRAARGLLPQVLLQRLIGPPSPPSYGCILPVAMVVRWATMLCNTICDHDGKEVVGAPSLRDSSYVGSDV
jgi:hypothetical protein